MATFTLDLADEYGWVLLCSAVMAFSVILVGFIFAGSARTKAFTEEFMRENFNQEHKALTGNDIQKGGYPDTGSGYYSRKLSYEQWYALNNGQRAHMNYIEWIASYEVFLLVGGVYFPIPAAAIGLGVVIFRIIYAAGYTSGGPSSRLVGALGNDLLVLAQFVLAVISSIYFIRGDTM